MSEEYQLSEAVKAEIDKWTAKFPSDQKRSAIIAALHAVQEEEGGYLPSYAMGAVAEYLGLPPVMVYELATFYDMFELSEIGQHKISVCTNLSCQLMGSDDIVARLEKRLGIKMGETTADGQFTLREVECLAACKNGPMCQIDNKDYVENLTVEKVDALIDKLGGRDGA